MNEQSFAALSRRVAAAASRRNMLGALAAGVVTMVGRPAAAAQVADEAFGFCRLPQAKCSRADDCCAGKCKGGVCGCRKRGKNAIVGAVCCSGKAKKGKCR
jgi:hypothetical protein